VAEPAHPSGPFDVEALTVAMAIAPGTYSRNKFFELFRTAELRRARRRAAMVRGIVQHLVMLQKSGGDADMKLEPVAGGARLRYRVPTLSLDRRVDLDDVEASCLMLLADRAGVRGLAPSQADRDRLHAALRRLKGGEAAALSS
jgi:hypothetical protein